MAFTAQTVGVIQEVERFPHKSEPVSLLNAELAAMRKSMFQGPGPVVDVARHARILVRRRPRAGIIHHGAGEAAIDAARQAYLQINSVSGWPEAAVKMPQSKSVQEQA